MSHFNTLTVYLGSSGYTRDIFRLAAEELGALIAARGKRLVYGGMDAGLMGLVAGAALRAGAKVTGIIPKNLKDSERIHPSLSETVLTGNLWERKRQMFLRADAIIGLPGGYGTLDECLEVLYWGGLGLHGKPLALVDIEGYWEPLIEYVRGLEDFDPRYLIVAEDLAHLFEQLERWPPPVAKNHSTQDFPHFEDYILRGGDAPLVFTQATIEESYRLITALGLKQLDKHERHIGILNEGGRFDGLLRWIDRAAEERFITPQCKLLLSAAETMPALEEAMRTQPAVHIDLHRDKWGPSTTATHLEVREEAD